MKNTNVGLIFSRFMVFSLLVSMVGVRSATALSVSERGVASGELTVTGSSSAGEKPFVVVNGERAFNGRTFFSDGMVSTTETSSATISLGKLGRVTLAPSSSLNLSFSGNTISGYLSKGQVSVSNVDGVSVKIDTPNDAVKNEGTSSSRFTVAVVGDKTGVAVAKGTVSNASGMPMQTDDDDDDDHWKAWAWVGVIAAAVVTVILITTLGDDDDTVSPVR